MTISGGCRILEDGDGLGVSGSSPFVGDYKVARGCGPLDSYATKPATVYSLQTSKVVVKCELFFQASTRIAPFYSEPIDYTAPAKLFCT